MGAKGWHREDIKAALRKRLGSMQALARAMGRHPHAISNALRQPGYSTAIERRIAQELGVPLHELWPARWTANGVSLSGAESGEPKPSRSQPLAHRQIKEVA